ncbi:MAG: pyridoxal-phosphate dependent enzyme, partial [Stackebrandtia sp.]
MISEADVVAARRRIEGKVRITPVLSADPGDFAAAARVWLKCEFTQHTGSFKARGAFNRLSAASERGELTAAGVVAASGGNA